MLCPQCGTDQPDGTKFCAKCGQDMSAAAGAPAPEPAPEPAAAPQPVPTYAPAPTMPMPQVPAAPTVQMPPVAPPVAAPPAGPPAGYYAPGPGVPPAQPPKKKRGLVIALVIVGFLLLCCVGAAIAGYVFYLNRNPATPKPGPTVTTKPKTDTGTADETAEIEAAAKVVEDYYLAIGAGDMDAIGELLAPDVAEEITPDWYEGWDSSTAFDFTRGMVDGDTATIYGRETVQAYGSGGDGGVKFTLVKSDGVWRIVGWTGADRTQIEGSDTTGASSGVKTTLTEASARQIVTELLQARQKGNANAIRQLTTEAFQSANGDIWLDGIDNTEYFLSFKITDVSLDGKVATVTVDEEWNSGPETGTYTVISKEGALLVDTWN